MFCCYRKACLRGVHLDLPGLLEWNLSSATPWDGLGPAPLRGQPGAGFLTWVPEGRSLSVSGHTFRFGGKPASGEFLRFMWSLGDSMERLRHTAVEEWLQCSFTVRSGPNLGLLFIIILKASKQLTAVKRRKYLQSLGPPSVELNISLGLPWTKNYLPNLAPEGQEVKWIQAQEGPPSFAATRPPYFIDLCGGCEKVDFIESTGIPKVELGYWWHTTLLCSWLTEMSVMMLWMATWCHADIYKGHKIPRTEASSASVP